MAKKGKPTSSGQWAKKKVTNYTVDYNPTTELLERPKNISLRPQEATLVNLLKKEIISTIRAWDFGIMSPSSRVRDLKKKGAQIEVEYKDLIVEGVKHKRVAFYSLKGWKNGGCK
jgi:hypothetical protein